jgi:hypothetical protein
MVTIRETGEKHELTPEALAELVENKIKGKPFFECSLADRVSKRPLF